MIESEDRREGYREYRLIATGMAGGECLTVVCTLRAGRLRIIRASRQERHAWRVRRSLAQARADARVDPERLGRAGEAEIARQAALDPDTASLQEDLAAALAQGEAWVARPADPRAVRERLGISQAAFARMLGVSVWTLRNGEQGRGAG